MGALACPGGCDAHHLRGEQHVLDDGGPGQQRRRLEYNAGVGARFANPFTTYFDDPLLWQQKPGRESQKSRFSAAGRPNQTDELIPLDFERHVCNRGRQIAAATRLEDFPYALERDHRAPYFVIAAANLGSKAWRGSQLIGRSWLVDTASHV